MGYLTSGQGQKEGSYLLEGGQATVCLNRHSASYCCNAYGIGLMLLEAGHRIDKPTSSLLPLGVQHYPRCSGLLIVIVLNYGRWWLLGKTQGCSALHIVKISFQLFQFVYLFLIYFWVPGVKPSPYAWMIDTLIIKICPYPENFLFKVWTS